MTSLLPILLLGFIVVIFGLFLLFVSSQLGPKKQPSAAKMMPYESGVPGQESKDSKISVKFYLTAILFIIFDIEIIFMYPWAVTFRDFIQQGYGMQMMGAMGVFLLLFIVGLFWEVKSKALEWD